MDDIRLGIRRKEEYEEHAILSYAPVCLLIKQKNEVTVDKDEVSFTSVDIADDDAIANILTKEATEMTQLKAVSSTKKFLPFLVGAQFQQSIRGTGAKNIQQLHNKAIRKYSIQFDKDALAGRGGNNGLINSTDENYITEETLNLTGVSTTQAKFDKLSEALSKVRGKIDNTTAGNDLTVFYYGKELISFLDKRNSNTDNKYLSLIKEDFEGYTVRFVKIPSLVLPEDAGDGFIVVSEGSVTLDYTVVPSIEDQGVDAKNKTYWANYIYGSMQVRADEFGAIIKLPVELPPEA